MDGGGGFEYSFFKDLYFPHRLERRLKVMTKKSGRLRE